MKKYGYFFLFISLIFVSFQSLSKNQNALKPVISSDVSTKNNQPSLKKDSSNILGLLGWVKDHQAGLCGGYYLERITHSDSLPSSTRPISSAHITADHSELSPDAITTLSGHVTIEQGNRELKANQIHLYRGKKGTINLAELIGNVSLQEPGKLFLTEYAKINFNSKDLYLKDVWYRMTLTPYKLATSLDQNNFLESEILNVKDFPDIDLDPKYIYSKLTQLNAWGSADTIIQSSGNRFHLYNTSYSTCPSELPGWQLKAKQIDLDQEKGRGHARSVYLNIKDVPVLYLPYFNFPIDNRRSSGFLFPSLGYSTDFGIDMSVPYYWNIAPNYDAILTPRYMSLRGLMLSNKLRYLTPTDKGKVEIGFLPHDKAFKTFKSHAQKEFLYSAKPEQLHELKSDTLDRSSISFQDDSKFNEHLRFNTHFNWVSDDYYFQDLGVNVDDINLNQLEQSANFTYQEKHWNFLGGLQRYQTLHPINQAPINELYSRFPEIYATAQYPQSTLGFDYNVTTEWVNFDIRRNPQQLFKQVEGQRFFFEGSMSKRYPLLGANLQPSFYIHALQYGLNHRQGQSQNPHLILPIFTIDSTLPFQRPIHWFGNTYTQTLEPRLFYLVVPYKNQTDFPIFDTTIQPFNFDHLFRMNRFDGFDRINDANQLSFALSSKVLDPQSGNEILHAGLGQIIYFRHRNVQLCTTHDCSDQDNPTLVAVTPTKNLFSPLVGEILYHIDPLWSVRSQIAWETSEKHVNNGNFYLHYKLLPRHILNAGYVFIRDGDEIAPGLGHHNLSQADLSFTSSLSENWSVLGHVNYNISHNYFHTYLAGLQYDNCCWAIRAVASRTYKSLDERNNPKYDSVYYLQWLLKGLGSLGTGNPGSLLTESIPYYKDPFHT